MRHRGAADELEQVAVAGPFGQLPAGLHREPETVGERDDGVDTTERDRRPDGLDRRVPQVLGQAARLFGPTLVEGPFEVVAGPTAPMAGRPVTYQMETHRPHNLFVALRGANPAQVGAPSRRS